MSADGGIKQSLKLSKADALRHVELVTGAKDKPVTLRFLDDTKSGNKGSVVHGTLEDLWPRVVKAQKNKLGVFLIPNANGAPGTGYDVATRQAAQELVRVLLKEQPRWRELPMMNWPVINDLAPN